MTQKVLGLKIDVDTERGTKIGVPNLLKLLTDLNVPATFLFSLGPDNTGRAIRRIFRPGFLKKVTRTNVVNVYGYRTLLNGILWPGPHIGKACDSILRDVQAAGYEVGIHCYDHNAWQDHVHSWSKKKVFQEFQKACDEFERIFSCHPASAGAAGWQANENSLAAYDAAHLTYASDARGLFPCFPKIKNKQFKTLQIPTTLPTLDELIGLPQFPPEQWVNYYLSLLRDDAVNVLTLHAEIEGMKYLPFFKALLICAQKQGVLFQDLATIAKQILSQPEKIPICEFKQGTVSNRSGSLAIIE